MSLFTTLLSAHVARDKPAMLYFSTNLGDMANFDVDQFKRLQKFQKWCSDKGLYETYDSDNVFRHKFTRQLQLKLNQHPLFKVASREQTQLDLSELSVAEDELQPAMFSRSNGLVDFSDNRTRASHPDLTEKARVLLKTASLDPSGYILVVSALDGTTYQVNNEQLNIGNSRRELASWDEALEELERERLIRQKDTTSTGLRLYEMASAGYAVADMIGDKTKDWIE